MPECQGQRAHIHMAGTMQTVIYAAHHHPDSAFNPDLEKKPSLSSDSSSQFPPRHCHPLTVELPWGKASQSLGLPRLQFQPLLTTAAWPRAAHLTHTVSSKKQRQTRGDQGLRRPLWELRLSQPTLRGRKSQDGFSDVRSGETPAGPQGRRSRGSGEAAPAMAPTRALHGAAEPWGSRALLEGQGTTWIMLDRHMTTEIPLDVHTTTKTMLDGHRTGKTPLDRHRIKSIMLDGHRTTKTPLDGHKTM